MIDDDELKANIVNTKPYKQWIENLRIKLDSIETGAAAVAPQAEIGRASCRERVSSPV